MLLALETATKVCSVAFANAKNEVFEKRIEKRGTHSEQLFLFIEELKNNHGFEIPQLDAVLVSEGPGSYTGLRISASAVKGLLFQSQVPLIAINTLASFAMSVVNEMSSANTIHSVIDARRVHVYHQQFGASDGFITTDDEVEVVPIEAFQKMVRKDDIIVGTGLNRLDEEVLDKTVCFGPEKISAKSLISLYQLGLGAFCDKADPEGFEPKYYTSNQV
jgi:tRNA threonylcarbamoyl adenosine modification protein YeaZ